MHQLANPDDAAMLGHCLGDLLVVAQHMQPGEDRQMRHQLAILGNRIGKWDAVFEMRKLVILHAMPGRDMDEARSLVGGDIIGKKHRHVMFIAVLMHRVA